GLEDDLYAATSGGFVVRGGCDAGLCDYSWLARDGGVQRMGSGWRPAFDSSPVAPDVRTLSLIRLQRQSTCDDNGTQLGQLQGEGLLVDVESGQTLATVPGYVTHDWAETHFTSAGGWYRMFPQQNGICGQTREELRRTAPPFEDAQVAGWVVEQELPDGRWVVWRDGGVSVGLATPGVPGSYDQLATDVVTLMVRGPWVYLFSHLMVQRVTALAPSGARHAWPISLDQEWYALAASGRWVMLGGRQDAQTRVWPYRLHDMLGEFPDLDVEFKGVLRGDGLTLLGEAGLLVSTAVDAAGAQAAQVIDLRTGGRQLVSAGKMKAVLVGDDEAAILFDEARAVLVERKGLTELAAGPITDVYSLGRHDSPFTLPQRELALLVRSVETGRYALDAFNLATRRLVRLTDSLHWAPQLGWGLADELCGRPWVTRAAGGGAETVVAPSATLHFLEYPIGAGQASLLVMPADLLSPPRRLASALPIHCHAPLVSRDGSGVAALIDGYDTQARRFVVSAPMGP
ncbi:MAG TPA: hypothetical protein VFP52_03955, partial [Myxococcales bacterium]|nr:hypothetical protein [Myxococcales bacterium]